jgi:hypothetical protein
MGGSDIGDWNGSFDWPCIDVTQSGPADLIRDRYGAGEPGNVAIPRVDGHSLICLFI